MIIINIKQNKYKNYTDYYSHKEENLKIKRIYDYKWLWKELWD